MSDFESWRQPPAIYQDLFTQVQAESRRIRMVPMTLEPTSEPVWPEDEAREEADGHEVPTLAAEPDARELALHVRAKLPDRLQGCVLKPPPLGHLPTAGFDYYLIAVPTTFATELGAQGITPRRLALDLTLGDASDATSPRIPVACYQYPGPDVATKITEVGEFEIDLGKALTAIWPGLPDVLTAKLGGSLDMKKVRARVQATGKNCQECGWLIADSVIAYDFNPWCIVQAPKRTQLSIEARLRVEVWKRVALAFHKTYLIQAKLMRYALADLESRVRLPMGSEVTLNSPYADWSDTFEESPEPRVSLSAGRMFTATIDMTEAALNDARLALPDDAIFGPSAPGSDQSFIDISSGSLGPKVFSGYAVVCRRGHVKGSSLLAEPSVDLQGFCPECGAELLGCCAVCLGGIRLNAGQSPPKFCADCGKPFPWLTRPERFYQLENMLDREDADEATQLLVQDDFKALRTSSELDEKQQLEIWKRVRTMAPSLFSGPCLEVTKTLLTPYLQEGLGLPASA